MKKYLLMLYLLNIGCSKHSDLLTEEISLSNEWKIEQSLDSPLSSIWGIYDCLYVVGGSVNNSNTAKIFSKENFNWNLKEHYEGEFNIRDIEGKSCNEIYAVSSDGKLFLFNGNNWSIKEFDNILFTKVNIIRGMVYLSATNGFYLYNNDVLIKIIDETAHFQGAWGDNDGNNTYVVAFNGENDFIFHSSGGDWKNMLEDSELSGNFLSSIEGYNSNYIYAAGSSGTLLFYDGEEWKKVLEELDPINDLILFSGMKFYFATGSYNTPGNVYSISGGFYTLEYEYSNGINSLWSNTNKGIYAVSSNGKIISNLIDK